MGSKHEMVALALTHVLRSTSCVGVLGILLGILCVTYGLLSVVHSQLLFLSKE